MAGGSDLSQFDSSLGLLILGIMYHLHLGGGSIVLSLSAFTIAALAIVCLAGFELAYANDFYRTNF